MSDRVIPNAADVLRRLAEPVETYADRRPPALPAEPLDSDPSRVKVWCRYCRAFHYHGKPSAEGTRHRSAPCGSQCGNTTPYSTTGYLLFLVEPGYHAAALPGRKGKRR